MRCITLAALILGLTVATAFSQDLGDRQVWRKLGLTEEEISRSGAIYDRSEKSIREARVEIDVLKAEIRRVLYRDPVDMPEVEKLLRGSLEWEYRLRLAQIARQVELRRLLGDAQYARLMEAVRMRRARADDGEGNGSGRDEPGRKAPR